MKRIVSGLVFVTLVTGTSCSLVRRGRGSAPTPVIAAPPTKPPQPAENPQVPPPPKVEQAEAPRIGPPVATEIPAKPPPRPKLVKKPVRKPPAPIRAQAPPVETQPQPADPLPVLAPVLSASQQEAFSKAIDQAIQAVESGLAAVGSKALNPTQRANADRARSFVAQAQQTRATDLVTAKTLADRAVILAQSLVAELQ